MCVVADGHLDIAGMVEQDRQLERAGVLVDRRVEGNPHRGQFVVIEDDADGLGGGQFGAGRGAEAYPEGLGFLHEGVVGEGDGDGGGGESGWDGESAGGGGVVVGLGGGAVEGGVAHGYGVGAGGAERDGELDGGVGSRDALTPPMATAGLVVVEDCADGGADALGDDRVHGVGEGDGESLGAF